MIAAETFPPEINGAATFAHRLALGLAGRGHEVHVLAPSASGYARTRREGGLTVHRVRSHHWPLHPTWMICLPWETGPEMARLLDQIRPDVVHTQAHFVLGRYAFSLAQERGIPVVATNHFMPDNVRPYVRAPRPLIDAATALAWKDLRSRFQQADRITVPTQLASDLLTQNGFDHPIEAISCGIDLTRFDEVHALARARALERAEGDAAAEAAPPPAVLFVGRLSQEKHPETLVEALALTDPALRLEVRIVGEGDQTEPLRRLAEARGVSDRVHLLGKIGDAELTREYASAAFFCMPSTAELQSIATLEALACGLPVVLADAVALPHLVRDGENGYLFRPRDADDLAAKFTALLTASPQRWEELREASRALVRSHDIRRTISRFEEIYREVVAGRRVTAPEG